VDDKNQKSKSSNTGGPSFQNKAQIENLKSKSKKEE
jgi:hypothetical protein